MVHTSIHLFLTLPLGREQEQKGRKAHSEIAQGIAQLPLMYTAVASLTSVFSVNGIAPDSQQCNSAENSQLESLGTFMCVSRCPKEKQGKKESSKKLEGGGDGRSIVI